MIKKSFKWAVHVTLFFIEELMYVFLAYFLDFVLICTWVLSVVHLQCTMECFIVLFGKVLYCGLICSLVCLNRIFFTFWRYSCILIWENLVLISIVQLNLVIIKYRHRKIFTIMFFRHKDLLFSNINFTVNRLEHAFL